MGRMRGVQYVVLAGCLLGALGCSVLAPVAVAASKPSTLVLHLKWRKIVAGPTLVSTDDSYMAMSVMGCPGNVSPCTSKLTLLDQRTGVRQNLLAPSSCGSEPTPDGFGGPYLAVSCLGESSWLYDLDSHQWVSAAPNCTGCMLQDVGSHWLEFVGVTSCSGGHCVLGLFLQNIQTGEVKPDPVVPGGRTIEDLNSPSGVGPLCSPLRYPSASSNPQGLGTLQFSGPFALSSGEPNGTRLDTLERCGSKLQLALPSYGYFGGRPNSFLSSRAVVSGFYPGGRSRSHIDGRYLPSLRKFTASFPTTKTPTSGEIVGLTRRTVYVNTTTKQNTESLWAATLPPPPARRRH